MSCCKTLDCVDIDRMNAASIESTLDYCIEYCDRYFQCDTVAYMDEKLKEYYNETEM